MANVTLRAVAKYLDTSPSGRGGLVRKMREQSSSAYVPARNFWHWMLRAIESDRRTTRDGAALRACAANARDTKRAANFARVAELWPSLIERWSDAEFISLEKRSISRGGLVIDVKPTFIERVGDGGLEAVFVWLSVDELTRDTRRALLRLVQIAFPEMTAVFVDVHRGRIESSAQCKRLATLDAWLDSEAAGLAHLLDEGVA